MDNRSLEELKKELEETKRKNMELSGRITEISNFACILHLEQVTQSIIEEIFLNLTINSEIF